MTDDSLEMFALAARSVPAAETDVLSKIVKLIEGAIAATANL
ncbi:hypothetical protein [Leptolyngbya sp. UWPOB_LEPTO1]|nr:hypothetical protein [Leptolyngbya sp. UWPOB_LEPTO1]